MDLWVREIHTIMYQLSNLGDLLYVSEPPFPQENGNTAPTLQNYYTDEQKTCTLLSTSEHSIDNE